MRRSDELRVEAAYVDRFGWNAESAHLRRTAELIDVVLDEITGMQHRLATFEHNYRRWPT